MAATGVMQKREQEAALASMDPALRKERNVIEKLLLEGERNDVLNKWDIGKHVATIKAKSSWGDAAVEQVAKSMPHLSKTTLDAYNRLVVAFPKRESLQKLLKEGSDKGYHFGVTHLLAITSIDNEAKRNKLIQQAIKESLSRNDLIARVQNLRGGPQSNFAGKGKGIGSRSARPVSPRAGLQQLAAVMRTVQEREKVISDVVFKPLVDSAPADWDDALMTSLQGALDEVQSAEGAIVLLEKELKTTLSRGEKILAARKRKPKKGEPVVAEEESADEEEDEELEDDEAEETGDEVEAEEEAQEDDDDDAEDSDIEASDDEDEEETDDEESGDDDDDDVEDDDEDAELAEAMPPRPSKNKTYAGPTGKAKAAIQQAKAKHKARKLKA